MLRSLKRKQILPSVKAEALRDAGPVLEYAARRPWAEGFCWNSTIFDQRNDRKMVDNIGLLRAWVCLFWLGKWWCSKPRGLGYLNFKTPISYDWNIWGIGQNQWFSNMNGGWTTIYQLQSLTWKPEVEFWSMATAILESVVEDLRMFQLTMS